MAYVWLESVWNKHNSASLMLDALHGQTWDCRQSAWVGPPEMRKRRGLLISYRQLRLFCAASCRFYLQLEREQFPEGGLARAMLDGAVAACEKLADGHPFGVDIIKWSEEWRRNQSESGSYLNMFNAAAGNLANFRIELTRLDQGGHHRVPFADILRDIVGSPFESPDIGIGYWDHCLQCDGTGVFRSSWSSTRFCGECCGAGARWVRADIDRNVLHIAQTIYDNLSFEDLPVLADAMIDAGMVTDTDCSACRVERYARAAEMKKWREDASVIPNLWPVFCDSCKSTGSVQNPALTHLRSPGPHARGCWVVDRILGKELPG